jgi:hypothetical protein
MKIMKTVWVDIGIVPHHGDSGRHFDVVHLHTLAALPMLIIDTLAFPESLPMMISKRYGMRNIE